MIRIDELLTLGAISLTKFQGKVTLTFEPDPWVVPPEKAEAIMLRRGSVDEAVAALAEFLGASGKSSIDYPPTFFDPDYVGEDKVIFPKQ